MGWGKKAAPVPEPVPPEAGPAELFSQAWTAQDMNAMLRLAPAAYAQWWLLLVKEDPWHVVVETALVVFILYLVLRKKPKKPLELTPKDVDELIAEWRPQPLVPALTREEKLLLERETVVESFVSATQLKVCGSAVAKLNLASYDFLGLAHRPELKAAAGATLDEYGCGSCGPRGFYGSVMPHLEVEEAVAKFMGTEGAISYSDTASALSSTTPAFAKKGDLVMVDGGVHEALKAGVDLSRSNVQYFKHNDMEDLERMLKLVARDDRRLGRDVTKQRRFIVTEALFRSDGSMAPLEELVQLKRAFGYRLVLDETLSFATLGATGRGLTEHLNLPVSDVDVIVVTLEYALGSVGGLCLGSTEVVDHQRLSGAGYCFSAAAPPFVSSAGVAALAVLEKEPSLLKQLGKAAAALRRFLAVECAAFLTVVSDPLSPVVHAVLNAKVAAKVVAAASPKLGAEAEAGRASLAHEAQAAALGEVAAKCLASGHALVGVGRRAKGEALAPGAAAMPPTLRLAARAQLTEAECRKAAVAVKEACAAVLK